MTKVERPEFCTDEMLEFLDELRESGVTNMYAAGTYLDDEFPELASGRRPGVYASERGRAVLSYWMHTFSDRQSENAA